VRYRSPNLRALVLVAFLVSTLSFMAVASAYTACSGPLDFVAVIPDGRVAVQSNAAQLTTVYLCQIGGSYNGIGPDQCKAMLSILLAAQASGKSVGWFFSDPNSCASQQAYQATVGMYFGPMLQAN
jgi:hypothetical protein